MKQLRSLIVVTVFLALTITVVGCSEHGPVITFTVDTTTDGADINPGDGLSDDDVGNCTLRAAIQETNAMPGHDIISLPAGNYNLSIIGDNVSDATGDLDITDDLTIIGDGAGTTIIDGGNRSRVFVVSSEITVEISGVTLQNGNDAATGGGIYNSGTLTLTDIAIDSNTAEAGGGIHNSATGDLTIISSTVSNNTASSGGGIFNEGGMLSITDTVVSSNSAGSSGGIRNTGTVTIMNSMVRDNMSGCAGGGIDNKSGGTATITSSNFKGNKAPHGGGIANDGGNASITDTVINSNTASSDGGGILNMPGCTLTITNSTVKDNKAEAAGGINNAGNLTMTECIVSGNIAETHAGGFANGGTLIITNSTLNENRAETSGGGAIHNVRGAVEIINSTVSHNTSCWAGGGISTHLGGTCKITNCTISGNIATDDVGGGIFIQESTVTIINSTFCDNTAPDGSAIHNAQGTTTVKNSIIAKNNGPGFGGDPPEPGIYNLTDFEMHIAVVGFTQFNDMRLGPLADNGGPTHTHALLTGSPAIDAGDDQVCPDTDQRGITRPQDGNADGTARCDVGAFES